MKKLGARQARLKQLLDRLYDQYLAEFHADRAGFFVNRKDPILFPHRYTEFHDIEASAFLATTFAYGKVASLCAFTERLLPMLEPAPYAFLREGPPAIRRLKNRNIYYRLHKEAEILAVLNTLAIVYSRHGSLYEVFMESYDERNTTKQNIAVFTRRLSQIGDVDLKFLVPSPESGSPCKRLNLFLRWMVRRDGIDFGLWKDVSPAKLIIPVDTHIGQVARKLGWIETPSLTWNKAEQITEQLRKLDAEDPTRYDFSLCHESMSRSATLDGI